MRVIAHALLEPSHIQNIKAKYKMFLSANYIIEKAGYRLNALLISPRHPLYHIEISYSKAIRKREEGGKMRMIEELINPAKANLSLNEIRSVRFVKLDKEVSYSIIIDGPEDKEIYHGYCQVNTLC